MTSTTTTSQELLLRVAEGDRQAFEAVHDRFKTMVRAVVARTLGRSGDVEDVCQEVFLALWRQADRYDPQRGAPSTWIGLLARRRAVDALRSKLQHGKTSGDLTEGYIMAASPNDALSGRELEEDLVRIRKVIAKIPEEQRSAIALSVFGGFKGKHIAAIQRVPHATVKTRLRRGVQRMRSMMLEADAA